MKNVEYKVSGYRWIILGAFMFVNLTIQLLWISYAPVTGPAAVFYGVSELKIGFFSMVFMIAFLPLSIPISWLIDRFGFAKTVGAGSVLTAAFALLRGFAGANYALALAATCGMAAMQPFLLNAWTKVPAAWFPAHERATAVGLITLANIVGTAFGLIFTPILAVSMSLPRVQLVFGAVATLSAALFVCLARERPKFQPDASASGERALQTAGILHALKIPSFRYFLFITFVGMGVFNGVTTWIEGIVRPRGIDPTQAGLLGAIMLIGGVVGAVVIPALSDRSGRRGPYIALGLIGAVPGILGLAFAPGFFLIALSCLVLGFFLIAVNPVGMQFAAEAARPTPEGTSNGLVSLAGQSAVMLVFAMEALNKATGSFTASLAVGAGLLAASAILSTRLSEKAPAIAAEAA